MRVLTMALCGALLTVTGAESSEAQEQQQQQQQQVNTARAAANMQRGMRRGIFSEKGKKPTFRVGGGAPASSIPPVVTQVYTDGGPMTVPTYQLPNGVVLQASDGINPAVGVSCIAYCQNEVVTRLLKIPG